MVRSYGWPADDAAPGAVQRASPAAGEVVDRIVAARRETTTVRLEGVHALKHAVRFGAEIEVVATPDLRTLAALLAELAPDVRLPVAPVEVSAPAWRRIAPRELPSPALSLARRPSVDVEVVRSAPGRIVVLERPRHLGNLGAVVRVAAAAGAGGILVVGDVDPWHPTAVRSAAGLQFALPVARTGTLPAMSRPLVALHPEGDPIGHGTVPPDTALLVGTERGGLSGEALAAATARVAIPMRTGVSSLNLATAVAVALYLP